MAHIIQRKTLPLNHHLAQKWSRTYPNTVLGAQQIFLQENHESLLANFSLQRRKYLQEFYLNKEIFLDKAYEHGRASCKTQLLANLISASVIWNKNIDTEANNIFYLGQKICTGITGKHKESKNNIKIVSDIKDKLNLFFSLKIVTPIACFLKIKQEHNDTLLDPDNPYFLPAPGEEKTLRVIINSGKNKRYYDIENVDAFKLYRITLKELAKIGREL